MEMSASCVKHRPTIRCSGWTIKIRGGEWVPDNKSERRAKHFGDFITLHDMDLQMGAKNPAVLATKSWHQVIARDDR